MKQQNISIVRTILEAKGSQSIVLFLEKRFVELINNCHTQQDTCSSTDCSHKVGNDGQSPNAHSTEGSRGGDVTIEDVNESRITVSLHDHLIVSQLLGNVASGCPRNLNPSFGEEGAGSQDEDEIEDGVEWIVDDFGEGSGRRDVVGDSSNRDHGRGTFHILPLAQETHENVCRSAVVKQLRHEIQLDTSAV